MKRLSKVAATIIASAFIGCLSITTQAQIVEQSMYKFGRLLRLVDSYYVDTTNISKITEKAIVGMLAGMDPHSVYISKEEVAEMNEPLEGNFEGIGISFNIYQDTLMVLTTVPGGPSEKVGLHPSDRIVNIDGKMIAGIGLKNTDVFKMLKGPKGTEVKLKIVRRDVKEPIDFVVIRDKIPINSLAASYMLNKNTGYILLNRFAATTFDEFMTAAKQLKSNPGFQNLIVDLRGNGGGYLNAAYELSDQFLDGRKMIVYTEGVKSPRKEYESSVKGELEQNKVVILIDEGSASASEILSGAIQDWDRGVIVGRRSYGKGLVQQQFPLTDGSMVRLTTAHYYTPSGRCIQKPYTEGLSAYQEDPMNRYKHGELFYKDSIQIDKKLAYLTKVNGRTVYGGGGIIPDVFVPLDTSSNFKYYNELLRKNVFYNQVLSIMDKTRDQLKKKYPTFAEFKAKFEVDDAVIDEIVQKGEKAGIKKDEKSLAAIRPMMKKQIKALFARDLYSTEDYYEIANTDSPEIAKALEIISNNDLYKSILSGSK